MAGYYDETEEMRHDARTSVVCGSRERRVGRVAKFSPLAYGGTRQRPGCLIDASRVA
jgi:hypothetical protein